jgi:dihydrodipicolinate synthase/N-acetylneuraminate lyase
MGEERLEELRAAMEAQPFVPAVKHVLGRRGLPVLPDVRAPLQPLDAGRAAVLDATLAALELSAVGG